MLHWRIILSLIVSRVLCKWVLKEIYLQCWKAFVKYSGKRVCYSVANFVKSSVYWDHTVKNLSWKNNDSVNGSKSSSCLSFGCPSKASIGTFLLIKFATIGFYYLICSCLCFFFLKIPSNINYWIGLSHYTKLCWD